MSITIQDVINKIMTTVPEAPLDEDAPDIIMAGDPSQEVTGIVTTFLASYEVIEKSIALGANLIISHEGVFVEGEGLAETPIYKAKQRLIDENNVVIWRFHDYWHLHRPDGILKGVLKELGWDSHINAEMVEQLSNTAVTSVADYYDMVKTISHVDIPPMSLREVAGLFKKTFAIERVKVVGDLDMICRRVVLLPGKADGRVQTMWLAQEGVDLLICGEINEWEVNEYVRDAVHLGQEKGVLIAYRRSISFCLSKILGAIPNEHKLPTCHDNECPHPNVGI